MTHVFYRMPRNDYPRAIEGENAYIIDSAGKRYIDASGGAAVSCLGHSETRVIDAIKAQLDRLPFAHTAFFTTPVAEELADFLASAAPGDLNHVYFVSGGSEAIESALKLARQYFVERGELGRRTFIARRQSYHGNTLGALSVGGNQARRTVFEPILLKTHHVSPCYPYRGRIEGESDDDYTDRLAAELDSAISGLPPQSVIAFVAETVVGATLGAVPPVTGYFHKIRQVCDRHGVLLILDEVMCGMGRTGSLFACEQERIVPDIVTIAKGLGAGYQPIGAMIASEGVYRTVTEGSGFFQHGHTYLGHASACAAALAVQKIIVDDRLLEHIVHMSEEFGFRLRQTFGNHEHVGDIRGRGLFWGVEFVADRTRKLPFEPSAGFASRLKQHAMQEGLICYPSSGTIDGIHGDHVMLAPPYIVRESQLDEIIDKLQKAVFRTLER